MASARLMRGTRLTWERVVRGTERRDLRELGEGDDLLHARVGGRLVARLGALDRLDGGVAKRSAREAPAIDIPLPGRADHLADVRLKRSLVVEDGLRRRVHEGEHLLSEDTCRHSGKIECVCAGHVLGATSVVKQASKIPLALFWPLS